MSQPGDGDGLGSDDATQQVPVTPDGDPPSTVAPDQPNGVRKALPWVVAGVALVFAAVVGALALRDGDDPDELDTASASGGTTTDTKPAGSDEPAVVEGPGDPVAGDKGASPPPGARDPGQASGGGAQGGRQATRRRRRARRAAAPPRRHRPRRRSTIRCRPCSVQPPSPRASFRTRSPST